MSSGLFDAEPSATAATDAAPGRKEERRNKLYPWDYVAAQLLEPYGESCIDSLGLDKLWEAAARGNKKCEYHTHLAADLEKDAWHAGAGISITAATLATACAQFRTEDMKKIIKDELYERVLKEIQEMEPVFKALNLGKGSQGGHRDTGSFRAAKKMKAADGGSIVFDLTAESSIDTVEAARRMHRWLSKEKSPLRSMLFILSGKNTYYTGHVAEKVARAAIVYKPFTEEQFVTAMRARMQRPSEASTSKASAGNDTSGLFDVGI